MPKHTLKSFVIAASSMLQIGMVRAQLDIDCFVVSDLYGNADTNGYHESYLANLMAFFKPSQRIDKITIYQEKKPMSEKGFFQNKLTSMMTELFDEESGYASMTESIGTEPYGAIHSTYDLAKPV